jgi:hypothetical protein
MNCQASPSSTMQAVTQPLLLCSSMCHSMQMMDGKVHTFQNLGKLEDKYGDVKHGSLC